MPEYRHRPTQWEDLTIANDFVFCKAMLDEGLCRDVLEAVLQVEIDHVEQVERQHAIDSGPASKAVRLDVYVRDDEGTVYDVEMQVCEEPALARRARYYHAQMAVEQLERGLTYRSLPSAFSIFICLFDPFGLGRRVYSFESRCREVEGLALGDGATTVFLSATSPADAGQPDALNSLLDYIAGGAASDELSQRVDARVRQVIGSTEWRREYMLLEWRDQDNVDKGIAIGLKRGIEQGREQGLEQGLEQGKQAGEERMGALVAALLAAGRADDAALAAADPEARRRLMEELGIA